jgi:beta-N-acetylhexosaminidase
LVVVRLEADPNIAVGSTPWGPAESTYVISPEQSTLPSFQPNEPVLVVGRDIHQHPFAREAVDRLRSADVDVLVVDMGWPADDRRYADVATFGASPLMGRALLTWLGTGGD